MTDHRIAVRDVLVIVPGILGSRLVRAHDGEVIWGGTGTLGSLARPSRLALHGDGFTPESFVTASGLVRAPAQIPGLSKIDAYSRLLEGLKAAFILDDTNFLVFAYDWRLSCAVNARILASRVEPLLATRRRQSPDAGLVFVAHSMGGLLVQHFTDVLGGGTDTKRIITIGTPYRGSIKAFGSITRGPSPSLPVLRSRIRNLVRTLPSVYELLPRYKAIIDGHAARTLASADLPEGAHKYLFTAATAFHGGIDQPQTRAYGRNLIVGAMQPTPQFATVRGGEVTLLKRWSPPGGELVDERGDGTVPRQSVTPPDWSDDADATPFSQGHVALPNTDDVFRVVRQVLTAKPRAAQAPQRAKLAIDVPDVVASSTSLEVSAEIVEGDQDIPLLISIEPLNGRPAPPPMTPTLEDDALIVRFQALAPGDHKITVQPAVLMPDVQPVWDLVTILDPTEDPREA